MLRLDAGQPLEAEVRNVAIKAAKAFEAAGAIVTEVDGFITREMLNGLDNFWRARMWDDLLKLSDAERARVLPYIHDWAEATTRLSGLDVFRGFNVTMALRAAAGKLFCDIDYLISPVSPGVKFPAEFASPVNDPAKPFEHICYTVPWNMSENPAISVNGGYDKRRLPDRRPDRRPALRRHRCARHGQDLRKPARPAAAVADPAEEIANIFEPSLRAQRSNPFAPGNVDCFVAPLLAMTRRESEK